MVQMLQKIVGRFLKKLQIELPRDSAVPPRGADTLGAYS